MGRGARARRFGALAALALSLSVATASADPLKIAPEPGKLAWGNPDRDPLRIGLILETRALGVIDASRLTTWPDLQLPLDQGIPELVTLEIGLVGRLRCVPLTFLLRADLAEPTQPGFDDEERLVQIDAIAEDAWIWWQPWRPLGVVAGRARVPWSKSRQWEDSDEPLGAPPFLIDRVAPDRRWGVTFLGDLGAMSYAGGIYEDTGELEQRAIPIDVSTGGLLAAAAHVEWTPVAPMYGSNPVGRVRGALGPLPTPRKDPWFATPRLSLGLGGLWRLSEDHESRFDLSFSAHLKWRFTAVLAEGLFAPADADPFVGAHVSWMLTPLDHLAVTVRGELDAEAEEWTLGGGATWHVTKDRRNKLGVVLWFREGPRQERVDGIVALLQASL